MPTLFIGLAFGADFSKDVQPVLAKRCVMCHGGAQQLAGVRLDNAADALKGGYTGAVLVAGKPELSKLIERVNSKKDGFRMPPAGPPLNESEIASLKAWMYSLGLPVESP